GKGGGGGGGGWGGGGRGRGGAGGRGASWRARLILVWTKAGWSRSGPPPVGRKWNWWQKRLARWLVRESRVSSHSDTPSESRGLAASPATGWSLPLTVTSMARPASFHARRTSANGQWA